MRTGAVLSDETKKKISEKNRGRKKFGKPLSEETKRKIGEANKKSLKGRTFSEEHRKNLSQSVRNSLTEETKIKMSESKKGNKNPNYGTMWITDGFKNQKIKNDAPIPEGWRKGRKIARVAQR